MWLTKKKWSTSNHGQCLSQNSLRHTLIHHPPKLPVSSACLCERELKIWYDSKNTTRLLTRNAKNDNSLKAFLSAKDAKFIEPSGTDKTVGRKAMMHHHYWGVEKCYWNELSLLLLPFFFVIDPNKHTSWERTILMERRRRRRWIDANAIHIKATTPNRSHSPSSQTKMKKAKMEQKTGIWRHE